MQTFSLRKLFSVLAWFLLLCNTLNPVFVYALAPDGTDGAAAEWDTQQQTTDWNNHWWSWSSWDTSWEWSDSSDDNNGSEGESWESSLNNADPAIKISCIVNGQWFDLNDLSSSWDFACGEQLECWVWYKNMWTEDTINFVWTATVNWWTIVHSQTSTTWWISCSQTSSDSYECDWTIAAWETEDLFLIVDVPTCECEETWSFTVDWTISVDNDSNTSNNSDTFTVNYEWEACEDTCVNNWWDYNWIK